MMKAIRLHLTSHAPHLTAVSLVVPVHVRVTAEVHLVRVGNIVRRRRPVVVRTTRSKHALAFVFLTYCVGCMITSRSSAQNSTPFIGAGHLPCCAGFITTIGCCQVSVPGRRTCILRSNHISIIIPNLFTII